MKVLGCIALLFCSFYICTARNCYDGVDRPCLLDDFNCIGRVFAEEMQCDLVEGDIPDTRIIHRMELDYPSSNSSVVYNDATATGLSDFTVNNFYINRKNNTLVLEVVFNFIDVEAPNTDGYWFRKGQETIMTNGYCYTMYNNYSLTLTVFNVDKRRRVNNRLNDFTVFTYVSDADEPVGAGKSFIPSDPTALAEHYKFYEKWSIGVLEEAVNQGPLFMSYILPCDLKLSKFS